MELKEAAVHSTVAVSPLVAMVGENAAQHFSNCIAGASERVVFVAPTR
ncbi:MULTISPECIES: hypothetical protein [unclassified Saccharothrix]